MIQGNTVYGNSSSVYGGGIVLAEGSRSLVTGNNIAANRVTSTASSTGGGGIFEANSDSQIWNNVLRANSAHGGGGLCFSGSGAWVVLNNTVIGNQATGGGTAALGGGMFVGGKTTGKTSIVNNIFAQNNDFQIFDSGHLSSYDNNLVVNGGKGAYYGYGIGAVTNISQINGNGALNEASGNLTGNLGFMNAGAGRLPAQLLLGGAQPGAAGRRAEQRLPGRSAAVRHRLRHRGLRVPGRGRPELTSGRGARRVGQHLRRARRRSAGRRLIAGCTSEDSRKKRR